jgi:microsomal dipeptidase-like Zn-dependent dipeptidase
LDDTLRLLDSKADWADVPLMATHSACRLGKADHEYNIQDRHIDAIAKRRGIVGLIACKHWMADGLAKPKTFDDSMELLYTHIDHVKCVTGSHEFTGIGTDLDGFIKPTLPGLELPEAFKEVEARLAARYTPAVAAQICSENALRVLQHWGHKRP